MPEDPPRPAGLCAWGKTILFAILALFILLPAWSIYSCATMSDTLPLPTPGPMPDDAITQTFQTGDEWAAGPDRKIRISTVERVDSYRLSSGEVIAAPRNMDFLLATVLSMNTGRSAFVTSPAYFLLADSDGREYADQTYSNYRIPKPYPAGSLTPGVTVSGTILWVVPASAFGFEITYLLDPASSPPVIASWTFGEDDW
ncbi:MAG: DUF4352 domain-containing protein [Dehalococcoidia bacterium]|nr:DUF4352 domain-containing protein [Dehalococcoidia bacterium]